MPPRRRSAVPAAVTLTLLAGTAGAQTPGGPVTRADSTRDSTHATTRATTRATAAPARRPAAALQGVTVVGQKRRTASVTKSPVALQDLPIAVQIVGQDVIRQQQVTDLREVVRNVSGVTATGTYNGGYVYYNGRGFWMNNWSNFRRNGMMVWNMGHHYADNFEQVEVLKGPASIQYGDVAPGGIMNFVTKQPAADAFTRVELRVGQYGLVRPTLDVNRALNASGTLLGRLNATYERSNSFRDQVQSTSTLLAPTLRWDATPRLSVTLEATARTDRRTDDPGLISPDGSFAALRRVPVSRYLGEPTGRYGYRDLGLYSTARYALTPAWTFQNVTYYSDTHRSPQNIYFTGTRAESDGTVERTQYYYNQWFRGWGTSADLIGEASTGPLRHRLLAGVDYMYNSSRYTNGGTGTLATNIAFDAPRYGLSPLAADPMDWSNNRFFYDRVGVYAQDQVGALDDRVQLLVGARWNATATGAKYDRAEDAPAGHRNNLDRVVSPRLGLVVKPRPWVSLYSSWASSYEMNGQDWNDPSILVPPTRAAQFEAGAKTSLLRDRLGVTLTAFRLTKRDVYGSVQTDTAPTAFPIISFSEEWRQATYQGGRHRSQGAEVDVNGRLTPDLSVNAAASYIDAVVLEDPAFPSGNQLEGNARRIASVWANYRVPRGPVRGLELGGGAFYRGSFFPTTSNAAAERVAPFHSFDGAVGYTFGRVAARLNVSNLTNEIGYLSPRGVFEPLWVRRALLSLSTTF